MGKKQGRRTILLQLYVNEKKQIRFYAFASALVEQTEIVKQLIAELQKAQACVERSMEEQRKFTMGYDVAVQSSDNIVNSICHAISRAENTVITAQLSREDKDALSIYHLKLIEEEKKLFEMQMVELKNLHDSHRKDVRKFIKAESGFYLTGWYAKFMAISYIVLYISCTVMLFLFLY